MKRFSSSLLPGQRHDGRFAILLLLLFLGSWSFVIVHAFTMDITNDEAYSFFLIKTNYFRAMPGTANTHWLNSLCMKLLNLLFGDAPGWLRLQSVVAFPFFAWAAYLLSTMIKTRVLQIAFFCLLIFNPYLLDFFSLARGYAMALTFQLWMVVALIRAAAENGFSFRKWTMVFIFGALAILSNLSFLYGVMGVWAAFLLHAFFFAPNASYSVRLVPVRKIIFLFLLLFAGSIADLLIIKYYGKDLGYGGDHFFIGSVFGSVWEGSFYFSRFSFLKNTCAYISFGLICAAVIYFVVVSQKEQIIHEALWVASPIGAFFLLNLIFHFFFKTPFGYGRTALQWYPLGCLLIFFLLGDLSAREKWLRIGCQGLSLVSSMALILNFMIHANAHFCFDWRYNAQNKECFEDIKSLQGLKKIGVSDWFVGVYKNYYAIADTSLSQVSFSFIRDREPGLDPAAENLYSLEAVIISDPGLQRFLAKMPYTYSIVKEYRYAQFSWIAISH